MDEYKDYRDFIKKDPMSIDSDSMETLLEKISGLEKKGASFKNLLKLTNEILEKVPCRTFMFENSDSSGKHSYYAQYKEIIRVKNVNDIRIETDDFVRWYLSVYGAPAFLSQMKTLVAGREKYPSEEKIGEYDSYLRQRWTNQPESDKRKRKNSSVYFSGF